MQTVVTLREERPAALEPSAPSSPSSPSSPSGAAADAPGKAGQAGDPGPKVRGPFLPLLLGLAALLTVLLHQLVLLEQEREQLTATLQASGPQLVAAQQLRQSLDRLAADTQRLADGGNAPARVLVDELRRRGITINASATPTTTVPSATAEQPSPKR